MRCPACSQRRARRECPALHQLICPVCCGTKRLVEIACPPQCGYLASAREHPAAVVKRRQERDVAALVPTIRHLTERQHQLFFLFQSVIARHKPAGVTRLVDRDVADAAATLAATLETASRGLIYEHDAPSPVATGLVQDFKGTLANLKERGATIFDGEAAIVLRAIESGARHDGAQVDDERTYLDLVDRLLHTVVTPEAAERNKPASGLILPEGA